MTRDWPVQMPMGQSMGQSMGEHLLRSALGGANSDS